MRTGAQATNSNKLCTIAKIRLKGCGLDHGVGHGLPYGPLYGLPVVSFAKTRLRIPANLCKPRAPSICHIYVSLPSSWRRFAQIFKAESWWIGIRETKMPYKHSLWGTIARKRNYYKAPLANFSALRPVHSAQTGSQFLSLP